MERKVRWVMHGAGGRMGCRVIALAEVDPDMQLVAAWEHAHHPLLGHDAGVTAGGNPCGVEIRAPWTGPPENIDVVIDFSVPEASEELVRQCRDRHVPLVLATTGFQAAQQQLIRDAAQSIPLVWSPSMSPAVNLTMKLSQITAQAFRQQRQQVDVEILERHHRYKEDAPSGTALRFGEIVADVLGQTEHRHGREGRVGPRPAHEIGYHAIRVGDNPGEHTIIFAVLGETVELTVRSSNRDAYAAGAVAAAKFLVGRSPGLYSMWDVLGI